MTGSVLVVAALSFSSMDLALTANLIFAANLPLAAVEGIISVFMITFLSKMMPNAAFLS
jgi:ABC-type Co2+ transport system permease subunit